MNRLTIIAPIALLLVAWVTQPAEAYRVKRHDTQSGGCAFTNEGRQMCGGSVADRTAIPDTARTRTAVAACACISDSRMSGSTWLPTGRGCFRTKALRGPDSPPFAVAT